MMDNRQYCFDLIDVCCADSGSTISHRNKMILHKELLAILQLNPDATIFQLKNYVFVKNDWDRFHKTREIAISLGLRFR